MTREMSMSWFAHSHEHLHRTTWDKPEVVHTHRHSHMATTTPTRSSRRRCPLISVTVSTRLRASSNERVWQKIYDRIPLAEERLEQVIKELRTRERGWAE